MRTTAATLVFFIACSANDVDLSPDAAATTVRPDAIADLPDDGFGFACGHVYSPNQLNTACTTANGSVGWCDHFGACRRRCDKNGQDAPSESTAWTCPEGQDIHYIAGSECTCTPKICAVATCVDALATP